MTSVQEHWHRSQFDDQLSSGQSMQFLQLIPGTCWSKHRLLAAPSHWGQAPGTPGFVPQLCHPAVKRHRKREAHVAKGPQTMGKQLSVPWAPFLPGGVAPWASVARAWMMTLKKALGKKAGAFNNG